MTRVSVLKPFVSASTTFRIRADIENEFISTDLRIHQRRSFNQLSCKQKAQCRAPKNLICEKAFNELKTFRNYVTRSVNHSSTLGTCI